MNNIKVSENFYLSEFECHDGSYLVKIDEKLLELLQTLRNVTKKPIHITSGYRTREYNRFIGGSSKSHHMEGKAADIQIEGLTPLKVAEFARKIGFDGVGIYKTFVHVDVRGIKVNWTDKSIVN